VGRFFTTCPIKSRDQARLGKNLVEAGFLGSRPWAEKDFTYRKTNFILVDGLYNQELQSDESGVDE
jgi:hypothetical protein